MTPAPDLKYHHEYLNKYGILARDYKSTHDATDLRIAEIAQDLIGKDICREEKTGNWLRWNGHCWERRDSVTSVLDKLALTVKHHIDLIYERKYKEPLIFHKELSVWCHIPEADKDRLDEKLTYLIGVEDAIYKKLSSTNSRSAIMTILGQRLTVDPENLDKNRDKIVFTNGYFDCISGQFLHNEREQNATLCIRYNYTAPDEASRQNWLSYITSLGFDSHTLEYLQRSFGYAATGRGCEKRFWWFRGEGNTCKTTLIDLVGRCLDQYTATTKEDQWREKRGGGGSTGHTEDLARLRGKRLVKADEFKKNAKLDESVKRMTAGSGDINASRKGEKTIEFEVMFGFFFSSNFDCQIAEDDTAFLGRLNALTFKNVIDINLRDTQFVPKFLANGQNRMAILEWILEGARKYCESGIGPDPEQVKTSRKEFLEEQVSINEQLEEILEINSKAKGTKAVTLTQVLEALSQLQKSTRQHSVFSKGEVSKAITSIFGIKLTKSGGHSGFVGLSLKSQFEPKKRRPYDPQIDWDYNDRRDEDDEEKTN